MCNIPGWNSEKTVAERLNKSLRTLALWRKKGIGPRYSKLGKTIVYSDGAIAEYLDASEITPPRSAVASHGCR